MEKRTVLLAEADEATALDLKANLLHLGYHVPAVVRRSEELVRAAEEIRPDVVLTDVHLGGEVGGVDAAGEVWRSLRIPVVFLAAGTDAGTVAGAAKAEPFGFVAKPCAPADLARTIEVVLQKSAADAVVRESEARFRAIADTVPALLWMADAEGNGAFVNRAWLEFTGRSLEEERGNGWAAGLHPADLPHCERTFREALEGRRAYEVEYRLRRADGAYRCVLERAAPRFEADGAFAGYVGACVDVTERRRAEEALRESERKYSLVVQNASEAIFVLQDGVAVFANPAALRFLGLSEEEAIGRNIAEFLPPDQQEASLRLRRRLLGGEIPSGRREYRTNHPDGAELWIRVDSVVVDWNGKPATLNIGSDITDTKRAEIALRKHGSEMGSLNVELERRVAERTAELESFSHAVAHDLTTPLRAIDGSAAMLLENEGGRLTMEGKGRLARIRAAAQRGGRLIESLLRLVRLTREPLRPAPFDLSALAGRVAQRLQGADPGRRVVWEIESGLSAVADAGLVEEVLEQLFGNALKFTQRRDPARIAFGEQADGPGDGRRAFYVEDDGAGFDMKHAGELFGPFHRAHTDSEFPGLGIGLAVVERVVRRHGGTVRAEGETGRGARFIFTL